jgi:hypothetical protein
MMHYQRRTAMKEEKMSFYLKHKSTSHCRAHGWNLIGLAICSAAIFVGPGRALAAEEEQPQELFSDVVQDMNVASRWLSKMATDALTQETQKDAVEKLDKLIAELEKQQKDSNGSMSSANPQRPMADSRIKSGPGGMGKLHAADQDGKHWAELPAHERERILQSMTEGFPAHYQGVLEAYFKRIAEEKPLSSDEQAPVKNPAPTNGSNSGDASDAAAVSPAMPSAKSPDDVGSKSAVSK